ncbi:class I SAM-dependent methyltransferase [Streptomyces sp. NPDC001787]|uniref:class I SAM-dependent methyltransferase n=1 Tax=Streptomyces sp. NPDC001787 TaxID=3154523 RepID=UPI00331E9DF3
MPLPSLVSFRKDDGVRPLVDYTKLSADGAAPSEIRAAHQVYEHLVSLWAPSIIEAAHDLGFFVELADGARTADEVAHARGTDRRATRVMLDALYAYGLVDKSGEGAVAQRYVLPDACRGALLPGGFFSLVGKMAHDRNVAWNAWSDLARTVRRGTCDESGEDLANGISETDYEDLVTGINFWAPPIVDTLADCLADSGWKAGEAVSVLDVGCGTGLYGQLLLQRFPQWRAEGIDAPRIVPLADAQAKRLGVEDRFTGTVQDIWQGGWGEGADLILLNNMIHLQTAESGRKLLRTAAGSLAPDGLVCIADQVIVNDEESPQDRFAMLFAASMLATGGGDAHSLDTCKEWFAAAGLEMVAVLDAPMHRVVIAGHIGRTGFPAR